MPSKTFPDYAAPNSEYNRLELLFKSLLSEICTAIPVQVDEVFPDDASGPCVTVTPLVTMVDGAGQPVPRSPIFNVPYNRLQGGINGIIVDPEPKDIGYFISAMRDISNVKATRKESLPASHRKYSMADGVYFGGLLNKSPKRFIKFTDEGIEVEGIENVTVHAAAAAVIADEKVTVQAPEIEMTAVRQIVMTSPLTRINGLLNIYGGLGWTGVAYALDGEGSTGKMRFEGDIEVKNGDIVDDGISLKHHRHPFDDESNTTDEPV